MSNKSKNAAVINLFEGAFLQGQEVFVKVNAPDVETFHAQVSELSDLRRTRRFNPAKTAERETFKFVRQALELKGKHVHIHVVTETPEEGVYKSEAGAMIRVDSSFNFLRSQDGQVISAMCHAEPVAIENDSNQPEQMQHAG